MSSAAATLAILIISGLNAFGVYLVSFMGIYGDGSSGAMPLVRRVGWAWVGAFAVAALYIAWTGKPEAGIGLSAKALPYALAFVFVGSTLWLVIASLMQ